MCGSDTPVRPLRQSCKSRVFSSAKAENFISVQIAALKRCDRGQELWAALAAAVPSVKSRRPTINSCHSEARPLREESAFLNPGEKQIPRPIKLRFGMTTG